MPAPSRIRRLRFARLTAVSLALPLALSLAPAPAAERLRVATFNVLLAQNPQGQLAVTLNNPNATNPRRIAEIIQRVAPDVILLNEFDYDAAGLAADRFQANFLSVGQNGQAPIDFPYRFLAPSNTGEHSGYDLDNNGVTDSTVGDAGYAGDAFGFGEFPGKFGMLVLSKYPIVSDRARTFRLLRWKDMPGARIPPGYYSPEELEVFRVSSKSHWDVPIDVDGTLVHLLAHHPTPPIFDGPEDRNGRRNHDEIRLWADYLSVDTGGYIVDDAGTPGGLVPGERFVIVGDHNADPTRGDSLDFAINQLLLHPAVNADFIPRRTGMPVGPNSDLTADFAGQDLRVDYVLPSRAGFSILGGAVFWPAAGEPGAALISASDHRLVYLDLEIEPITGRAEDLGIERENGVVALTWRYEQGVVYSVENSPRLVAGSWEEVEGIAIIVDAEAGTASATIVDPAMRAHFFRVISRPE